MSKQRHGHRVREPVQVYLDRQDATLLGHLAEQTGLPKAELLRRGLRQLAAGELAEKRPGWSFDVLMGILGDSPDHPTDYAERHDEYLAQALEEEMRARVRPD